MIAVGVGLAPQFRSEVPVPLPTTFGWDTGRFPLNITKGGDRYSANLTPRDLVDAGIWTGAAIHVDSATGDGANTGQRFAAEILFRGEIVIEGSLGNKGGFQQFV
jgi:hypothetical protein